MKQKPCKRKCSLRDDNHISGCDELTIYEIAAGQCRQAGEYPKPDWKYKFNGEKNDDG